MSLNPKIAHWKGRVVWLVGASSGIGAALADALAAEGAQLVLSARNGEKLLVLAQSLSSSHQAAPPAVVEPLDVNDTLAFRSALSRVIARNDEVHLVVWLAGNYSPMGASTFDSTLALDLARVNFEAALKGLGELLPLMLAQAERGAPSGIALVSSVAGYSGLPKAVAYGPTKAALINLAESLYLHCHRRGLAIYLVNPGFVATPLTAQNTFAMPALQTPAQAARSMIRGFEAGHFEIHFPQRFTRWLKLLRLLPYWLYFPIVSRFTNH